MLPLNFKSHLIAMYCLLLCSGFLVVAIAHLATIKYALSIPFVLAVGYLALALWLFAAVALAWLQYLDRKQ
jgi:hypothetical protein